MSDCPKCQAIVEMLEREKRRLGGQLADESLTWDRRIAVAGAIQAIGASIVRARRIMEAADDR